MERSNSRKNLVWEGRMESRMKGSEQRVFTVKSVILRVPVLFQAGSGIKLGGLEKDTLNLVIKLQVLTDRTAQKLTYGRARISLTGKWEEGKRLYRGWRLQETFLEQKRILKTNLMFPRPQGSGNVGQLTA